MKASPVGCFLSRKTLVINIHSKNGEKGVNSQHEAKTTTGVQCVLKVQNVKSVRVQKYNNYKYNELNSYSYYPTIVNVLVPYNIGPRHIIRFIPCEL